jgi:hypothetical protein
MRKHALSPVHEYAEGGANCYRVAELTNNPTLFDRWAMQIGAVKANGQVFTAQR